MSRFGIVPGRCKCGKAKATKNVRSRSTPPRGAPLVHICSCVLKRSRVILCFSVIGIAPFPRVPSKRFSNAWRGGAKIARLRVTPHLLRHTFALNYLHQNPGKLVQLANLLGHESLDTTAIYTQPSGEALAEDLERSRLNVYG
jgi:integrase